VIKLGHVATNLIVSLRVNFQFRKQTLVLFHHMVKQTWQSYGSQRLLPCFLALWWNGENG
jgi:hypothetical protein